MKLLYVEEHLSCKNYVSDFYVGFSHVSAPKGDTVSLKDKNMNYVVFVLKGQMVFSSKEFTNLLCEGGEMIFASQDSGTTGIAGTEVEYLLLCFDNQFTLCDQMALESLLPYISSDPLYKMEIRSPMQMVLDSIIFFLTYKIQCRHLHAIKQKEIFLIFRTFYTKYEMARFMSPILNRDLDFKSFVLRHYQEVKTVEELADLCNISVRSFNRKFNEFFGDSPYSWMLKQKSRHVKNRLADGKTPFSQIIKEFGFSSPAHFTTYCKKHFGDNPTKLRRKLMMDYQEKTLIPGLKVI